MQPTLTWLDYSERDRRRALDVIDLFRESGTVDELGIGAVRDSFSDLLFPGTSTVQTRACYFLLLPWAFLRLERLRVSSAAAPARARGEELWLNQYLLGGPDTEGVFGQLAGRALKRLPSAAYWGGLWTWGIRLFPGNSDAYLRSLDGFHRRLERYKAMEVDPEGRTEAPANWHPHVPDPPKGFPDGASVALRRQDAEYLCDRIQARCPDSVLAELVRRAEPADLAVERPWDLAGGIALPPRLREQLHHARLFAVLMRGAALLYNLMLAQALGDAKSDLIRKYEAELADWMGHAGALEEEVARWELPRLWQIVAESPWKVGPPTRVFVESWVGIVRKRGPAGALEKDSAARRLIADRELRLKRGRARLHHRRHLELWGGASGADWLDYRWKGTKRILQDIFDGLMRPGPTDGGGGVAQNA
jgi:hypothetical protein